MAKTTIGKNINLDEEKIVLKHGRYTEADAAADAAEFENRPGRPSLGRGISPQVAFRVPESLKSDLAAVAAAEGRPEAQVARQALVEYLERHRGA